MQADVFTKLLGLGASGVMAALCIWLVLRWSRPTRLPLALQPGYPARDFPRRDLVESAPLRELCEIQRELLELYASVPRSSALKSSVLVFLEELRAVMTAGYELSRSSPSENAERLSNAVESARSAARKMVERARRLQASDTGAMDSELDVRLEVMHALADDQEER